MGLEKLTGARSGELNAKHRELLELQALAQRRLMGAQASFAEGMRAAKEVQKDLQWTQKRVEYVEDLSWRCSRLISSAVLSTTAQRANIQSNSAPLSDDTQHRSTTRSLATKPASRHC